MSIKLNSKIMTSIERPTRIKRTHNSTTRVTFICTQEAPDVRESTLKVVVGVREGGGWGGGG